MFGLLLSAVRKLLLNNLAKAEAVNMMEPIPYEVPKERFKWEQREMKYKKPKKVRSEGYLLRHR